MILVDTNVLSEPLKPRPERVVVEWLDRQVVDTLWVSTIALAEIRFGIAALPEGVRKQRLSDATEELMAALFADRLAPFDDAASYTYAALLSAARRSGANVGTFDALIAATAQARNLIVATRDTSPFLSLGLPVINPWETPPPGKRAASSQP